MLATPEQLSLHKTASRGGDRQFSSQALPIPNLTICTLTLAAFLSSPVLGQLPGVQGIAEREIRRQELMKEHAEKAIASGDRAMQARDFESAFSYYKSAVDALPSGGAATAAVRQQALEGFERASLALARQRISEGRLQDAITTVNLILEDRYLPNSRAALELQKRLQDPTRFNPALTPQFIANVEEVKQLIIQAQGFYDSGRYDLAFKRYEQVLNIDPYNIAARRGMDQDRVARHDLVCAVEQILRRQPLQHHAGGRLERD